MAFNLLGDGLRDVFDPRMRSSGYPTTSAPTSAAAQGAVASGS